MMNSELEITFEEWEWLDKDHMRHKLLQVIDESEDIEDDPKLILGGTIDEILAYISQHYKTMKKWIDTETLKTHFHFSGSDEISFICPECGEKWWFGDLCSCNKNFSL